MSSLLFLYFCGGILLVLISIPLLLEKVRPNPVYGFRIQATLNDPAVWYAVNKYFAKRLLVVGVVVCMTALAFYRVPEITVDGYALAMLAVFVVAFFVAMIQSWKYMKSFSPPPKG